MKFVFKIMACVILMFLFLCGWATENEDAVERLEDIEGTEVYRISTSGMKASYTEYTVSQTSDKYIASSNGSTVESGSLFALIRAIEEDGVRIRFEGISCAESIEISKSVSLSGEIDFSEGIITVVTGEVVAEDLSISMASGYIRLKDGKFRMKSGSVLSYGNTAVLLDYSTASEFIIEGGSVESAYGVAIKNVLGSVKILGGRVVGRYSVGVENSGNLTLSGNGEIEGFNYDAVTSTPVRLSDSGRYFSSCARVKYNGAFASGDITAVFLNSKAEQAERIKIYDKNGELYSLTFMSESKYVDEQNFLSVYLPYQIRYIVKGREYMSESYLAKDTVKAPPQPSLLGYDFGGWYEDEHHTAEYSFGSSPEGNQTLYGKLNLEPPTYTIFSKSFTYDAGEHYLSFEKLEHTLGNLGSFSFAWYKDGVLIADNKNYVKLRTVSDSGSYFCKLTFSYNGDCVTLTTPAVSVNISKCEIEIPQISPKEYSGAIQNSGLLDNEYYTVCDEGGVNAGEYFVALTLRDKENFSFLGEENFEVLCRYEILRAENLFLSPCEVENYYEGGSPTPFAKAKFGTPEFLFSSSPSGEWSSFYPSLSGAYYIKAVVRETDNYTSAETAPVEFRVLSDMLIGIVASSYPTKTAYSAFEKIDLEGTVVIGVYLSGKSEIIENSALGVTYRSGDCLLAADTFVTVSYGGFSIPIAVSTSLAKYDLSALTFSDKTVFYDGYRHTVNVSTEIIGQDGIPLIYKVTGGGIDAGVYKVTLTFYTESVNYATPAAVVRELTVLPRSVGVVFENLSFTYDSYPKAPSAYIITAEGYRKNLSVVGAQTNAGSYMARALIDDKNYALLEDEAQFEIKKADISFSSVVWSADGFVYDGDKKNVAVSNLPVGVEVVGYVDNSATEAGAYVTVAAITYDERNYNAPAVLSHVWTIKKADYDFSEFGFFDATFLYDGKIHYPIPHGELPVGKDGSSPEYEFSRGVKNVADGRVGVSVSYSVKSPNYNTPSPTVVYIEILPIPIEITWENLQFVYCGEPQSPTAKSEHSLISVSAGNTNAGSYTAYAEPADSNYKILNPSVEYVILKRENAWKSSISVSDVFESGAPEPAASAEYGAPGFRYYRATTNEAVTLPLSAGDYYVIAVVAESENYLELKSEPHGFCVIKVAPIKLVAALNKSEFVALSAIGAGDISAHAVNNDGSITEYAFEEISVSYENGSSLTFGDSSVTVSVGDFSLSLGVTVTKADYDMSGASWRDCAFVYDGCERSPWLDGLPEGVEVLSYTVAGVRSAGEYPLSAELSYDTKNYNPPKLPSGVLVIEPIKLTVAVVGDGKYEIKEGSVISGEALSFEFYREAERIYVRVDNPNYEITVIPLSMAKSSARLIVLIAIFSLLSGVFVFFAIYKSELIKEALSSIKRGAKSAPIPPAPSDEVGQTKSPNPPEPPCMTTLLACDEAHANSMISDSMAKNLLTKSYMSVEVFGRRKYIVNLSELCGRFSGGDIVDINKMKECGIVGKDAGYVKILGGGSIDKPLVIMANEFSLSAIKMIALTGGKAIRVNNRRMKNKE